MNATSVSLNIRVFALLSAITFGIMIFGQSTLQAATDTGRVVKYAENDIVPVKAKLRFSTLIILVAFLPLFTMRGVPGKIFAPMSLTYGFALTGALLFALLFAPVMAICAPSATSARAMARPIPRDPPVTSATFPLSDPMKLQYPTHARGRHHGSRRTGRRAGARPRAPRCGRGDPAHR